MSGLDFQDIRDRLVQAALLHVVFDGWSDAVLTRAAQDAGLDPTMGERAFLGGPAEAAEHFSGMADRLMLADLEGVDLSAQRVPDRVHGAVMTRLRRWTPQREAVRRTVALLALHPGRAARATARTVDALWLAAGDNSNDFSWYTRRATLAAVYSATVLCWLDDDSEDLAVTAAFLRRRLGDVGRVTGLRRKAEQWLSGLRRPGAFRPGT